MPLLTKLEVSLIPGSIHIVILAKGLGELVISLHLIDQSAPGLCKPLATTTGTVCNRFRADGGEAIFLFGGYNKKRAEADLQNGAADLIDSGCPYSLRSSGAHYFYSALS